MGQVYIQPNGMVHYNNGYYDKFGMWRYQHSFHPIMTSVLWTAAMMPYYNLRTSVTIYNGRSYSGNQVRTYLQNDPYTRTRIRVLDASRYNYIPTTRSNFSSGTRPTTTSSSFSSGRRR
jgi:hypothetical protein